MATTTSLGHMLLESSLVQPVAAAVEHTRVVPRLSGDSDRRAGAGEHDSVGPNRLSSLERQPPPVGLDVQTDELAANDLGLGPLGDLAQVRSPLPVRRPHPSTIDPNRRIGRAQSDVLAS